MVDCGLWTLNLNTSVDVDLVNGLLFSDLECGFIVDPDCCV